MIFLKNNSVNFLIFTLSSLLCLCLVELILNVAVDKNKAKSALPKELFDKSSISYLSPNFSGKFNNKELNFPIKINSKGLRDNETSYKKPKNTFRILGLGDSFTFSYTLFEDGFLTIIEKSLNKVINRRVDVIKAGVPGTGPDFYYNFFDKEGFKYDPDLILINLYIGNDITNIGEHFSFSENNNKKRNKFYELKVWLRESTLIYPFIVDKIKSVPRVKKALNDKGIAPDVYEIYNKNPDERLKEKWKDFEKIIIKFKESDIRTIVVILPSIFQIDENHKNSLMSSRPNNNYDVMYPSLKLEKLLNKNNIEYLNLTKPLKLENKTKPLIYKTESHFNKNANYVIANEITTFLKSFCLK